MLTALIVVVAVTAMVSCRSTGDGRYPYRLVYMNRPLVDDAQVDDIRDIAERASRHGYNGIVLSSHFDRIATRPPEYFDRLIHARDAAAQFGVAIIPRVFNVGYGAAHLDNDRNLAAAVPVRDQLFVVKGTEARPEPDAPVTIANGGFEAHKQDRASAVTFQDRPGETTFIDPRVAHSGRTSLRVENFDGSQKRFGRVHQRLDVLPFHTYRFRCWVKTGAWLPS